MKSAFKCFNIFLLLCGVFGADQDEVKSVSVMEGDSVTLDPDLTQIKQFNLIEWRFGDPVIAQYDGNDITYPSHTEIFRDRLQLDQTGSLTIMNMKTKHSGLYRLEISHSQGTSYRKFNVTVYESTSDAGKAEIRSMSLIEGNPVTLQTDVPQLYGDELILWRFGDEGKLIAKVDIEAKSSPLYYDERFRDRLQLENKTGSLIITNSRTTDSGLYTVKISSNKQKFYQTYFVTISAVPDPGLSPGAVAGIVVVFLLVSAAAAAGVIYFFRPRISQLPSETWSVQMGYNVTLNPETEIQTGDEIQWLFGAEDILIAEIKKETGEMITYDGPNWMFVNRLKLDETTGSLKITYINTQHTGLYTLKIRRGRKTLNKRFHVSVNERMKPVMEGDDVTLYPDIIMQTNDEIQWLFDDEEQQTVIAEINTRGVNKYDGPDWRFRDGLELDKDTCELTVTDCTDAHAGFYTLKIRRDRETTYKRFFISVEKRRIEVMEGESVTLEPAAKINKDDLILWLFGDAVAMFKRETGEIFTYDRVAGGRFKDRLKLNKTTGSLTIRNTRIAHSGLYKLQIISSSVALSQRFIVTVKVTDKVENKLVDEGDSVTLNPDTKIQRDDQILWMFGDEDDLIAQIRGGTGVTYDGANESFKDRLKLDNMTGSLTITNISSEHTGLYKLEIISSSRGILNKEFKVSVQLTDKVENKLVDEGDSVTLNPDTKNTEIQEDDLVLWMFGYNNNVIAQIRGGTEQTYDGDRKRFKDRLKLDKTTGSLTITNMSTEHTGFYKLQIISSRGILYNNFSVLILPVTNKVEEKSVNERDSVTLNPHTEIQRDDQIQWMFGDKNDLIAQISGGTGETRDGDKKRFKDRLKLNNTTGSLTITNISSEHTGPYELKIISSSRGILYKKFWVFIKVEEKLVDEGKSVTLNPHTEIKGDDQILWMFRDKDIAQIRGETVKIYDGAKKRFKDRLKLDKTTGSLTITNISTEHTGLTGLYKLQIISSRGILYKKFWVFIKLEEKLVNEGDSVTLNPHTKIQEDDQIQWMFGDKNDLIAQISGGTGQTRDGDNKRFKGRLKLDNTTGSLTITNISSEHTGPYELKIINSSGKILYKDFSVSIKTAAAVTNEVRKSVMNENNDSTEERVNESVTVVMPLLGGENLDVVNDEEGMSSL